MQITITKEIKDYDLMESVLANLFLSVSPWLDNYDWDYENKALTAEVSYEDPESDKTTTKTVTPEILGRGLEVAISEGYHHCGMRMTADEDCMDACWSDIVLQCALFGELVYG